MYNWICEMKQGRTFRNSPVRGGCLGFEWCIVFFFMVGRALFDGLSLYGHSNTLIFVSKTRQWIVNESHKYIVNSFACKLIYTQHLMSFIFVHIKAHCHLLDIWNLPHWCIYISKIFTQKHPFISEWQHVNVINTNTKFGIKTWPHDHKLRILFIDQNFKLG